jgi:hypothetical protein
MNIIRLSGVALLMGCAITVMQPARADATSVPQQPGTTVSTPVPQGTDQAATWATNTARVAPPPATTARPQPQPAPKKLPLADFGQWDESASEN